MSSDLDISCHMDFHFSESSNLTEPELDSGDGVGAKLDMDTNTDDVGQLLGSVSSESCSSLQNPQSCSKHDVIEFEELETSDLVTSDFMAVDDVSVSIMDTTADSVGSCPGIDSEPSDTVCVSAPNSSQNDVNLESVFTSSNVFSGSMQSTPISEARLVSSSALQSLPVCAETLQTVQVLPLEGLQTVQVVSAVNAAALQTVQVLSPHNVTGGSATTLSSAVLIGNVIMLTPTTGLSQTLAEGAGNSHPHMLQLNLGTVSSAQPSYNRMTVKEALQKRNDDMKIFSSRSNQLSIPVTGTCTTVSSSLCSLRCSSALGHALDCCSEDSSTEALDNIAPLKEICTNDLHVNDQSLVDGYDSQHKDGETDTAMQQSDHFNRSLTYPSETSVENGEIKLQSELSNEPKADVLHLEDKQTKYVDLHLQTTSDRTNQASSGNQHRGVTYVSLLKLDKTTPICSKTISTCPNPVSPVPNKTMLTYAKSVSPNLDKKLSTCTKPVSPAPIMFQVCGKDGSVKNVHINPVDVQHGGSVAVVQGTNQVSPVVTVSTERDTASVPAITQGDIHPYRCDLCSATFNRMGNYTRHRMIHTVNTKDDYRYKCEECGRLFLQRCDMKRHMLIHSKQQPFKCSECGKAYIRRSDLVVHTRFHRQDKAFKCLYCEKSFYQTGDLNRHVRLVHIQSSMLTCGHCNRTYAKEATLIRHMQTMHKDIIVKSLKGTGEEGGETSDAKAMEIEDIQTQQCGGSDVDSS